MARLSLRLDLEPVGRIEPAKIHLLEDIGRLGSISAAGRALGMSYRHAWLLIDDLNRCLGRAVVDTRMGGHRGGGAELTDMGRTVLHHYWAIERKANAAAAVHLAALEAAVRPSECDGVRLVLPQPSLQPSPL